MKVKIYSKKVDKSWRTNEDKPWKMDLPEGAHIVGLRQTYDGRGWENKCIEIEVFYIICKITKDGNVKYV